MKKIIFGILVLVVGGVSFFSLNGRSSEVQYANLDYKILQKWNLPKGLEEVSGIAWIGKNRIACVQDEDGIIFIYNLMTSRVENKIQFGKGGDYEGITVLNNDAYVLRSDGVIFEITDFREKDPQVRNIVTRANSLPGVNFEGICADPENNRLLLAVKEQRDAHEQKEIYAFDLNTKDTDTKPVFVIRLADPIFEKVNEKLKNKFSPGEISIHPKTGEHYILDGTRPKLLIAAKEGTPKELLMLRPEDFGNPEGLTFSPEGDLYISNEAADGPANILKIVLNKKSE